MRTKEEIAKLMASVSQEDIIKVMNRKVEPDEKQGEWKEVKRYYDNMTARPYSMRDMEEKCFQKNLCK